MANKGNLANEKDKPRTFWPLVLVCLLFIVLLLARPDLVWQILTGFAVFYGGLVLYLRSEIRRTSEVHEKQEATNITGSSYYALIDALQFPVYLLDRDANVKYANLHAAKVFGTIRRGEQITIRFRQPQLKKNIETALAKEVPVTSEYNEAVPGDSWFKVEISPLHAKGTQSAEENPLFLLTFHDQTEAHRMDQLRSDFIANASHELRTPLASLLGYIETIKGPAKDDPKAQARFLDVMLDQAERMSRLVNDLLSLSRIEMKSHVKPSAVIDLREVLKAVASSLEALAQQMEVTIELEMEDNLSIVGDRDELVQVFENLVENACKYGQEGKRVVVSLKRVEEANGIFALASVKDFGMGIAVEHQQRITERFYRVDVAHSRAKQGTGLGLAIVKHILNRHGSKLNIKSNPGQGAEFSVKFQIDECE